MLNNEFPPLGGGTGTVNEALLQRFATIPDLEIDLITSALGCVPEEGRFSQRIRILKVPVDNRNIHHSSNRELATYAMRALPLAMKLHRSEPYDVCFAWSAVPAGGVALGLRVLTGLRYLVRVCGPDIPGFEQRYGALYPILTPAIRAIWHGAQVVVAKCAGEADMIHAVDKGVQIELIPNGVDMTRFRPGDPIPDGGPLRLLCVGRLIERKGQRYLIEAVKRLTDAGVDVTLELVGTGDAADTYQAQVTALGIDDRVHFAGYVPRAQIAEHYAAAHVFVLPSYNEGMSVATLEAMAAGLPIVATNTPGMADLVNDQNGLIFNWGDVGALSHHLRYLAENRPMLRLMGDASFGHAKTFMWTTVVDRYGMVFEQMLAGSRRPGYDGEPAHPEPISPGLLRAP